MTMLQRLGVKTDSFGGSETTVSKVQILKETINEMGNDIQN